MYRKYTAIIPYLFAISSLLMCGCQPGAGHVEFWVTPKSENWSQNESNPLEVNVGQTVEFDGQRILPGTHPESAIKPLHNFTIHCDPKDAIDFDINARLITFKKAGEVTVWLVEMAPGFAHQSQEPVDQWDQFHQVEVDSNRLHFIVK